MTNFTNFHRRLARFYIPTEQFGKPSTIMPDNPTPPPLPQSNVSIPYAARESLASQFPPPPDLGQSAGMRMLIPVGRSGLAIAAGYLGLFSFLAIPAPVALIISILAIRDIKRNPQKHGMGRAIFGLVMGILGSIALVILAIGLISHR